MEFPDIIDMNVGGRHVSTSLSTLTKYPDSMLAAMFSGRHHVTQDKDGRYFIDADYEIFSHLLNYLRFGTIPSADKAVEVKKYAEYFGLDELKMRLSDSTLPTEDELFVNWTSDISGYSDALMSVKEQLLKCEVNEGFIFLRVRVQQICRRNSTICNKITEVLPNHLRGIVYTVLDVHTDCDVINVMTLMTLLAHDLKKCGVSLCADEKPVRTCCHYARLFKVV